MAKKAPGKSFRKGLSIADLLKMFPHDDAAEKWIAHCRWGDEPACPHCGGVNVQVGAKHPSQNYRCREKGCRKFFSVRTGTAMASSKLGYQTWAIAAYLMSTELKGRASMKLHRDLNVTQKTAWFLAHRLREAWANSQPSPIAGPVEVDETYVGGLKRNMPEHKRREIPGRGPVGKTAVVGIKDRATKQVVAQVVGRTDKDTLQIFVAEHVADDDVQVYTDDTSSFKGLPNPHETVKHSAQELREVPRWREDSYQRRRVVLEHAQASAQGHISPDFAETPTALCGRVRGQAEREMHGYHRPDACPDSGAGGQAAQVRAVGGGLGKTEAAGGAGNRTVGSGLSHSFLGGSVVLLFLGHARVGPESLWRRRTGCRV